MMINVEDVKIEEEKKNIHTYMPKKKKTNCTYRHGKSF